MSVEVITFGCRLNQEESTSVKKYAESVGLEHSVVLNSCAVTSEAERQLQQTIRKLHKQDSTRKIIVTGCAAQINPQKYAAMNEVSAVIGNVEKLQSQTYLEILKESSEKILVNDIMSVRETAHYMPDTITDRTRAFLQIQNGCNHRCTFCIIPYGRGNSRSVPVGEIVRHARNLIDLGFQEIVLTGVDITDYGFDLPGQPSLVELIKRLLIHIPNLPRLRLSSVDVAELRDDFIDLFANEKRLMPHLHISLQAGDDMILKRMKRRHLRNDAIKFCENARNARPDVEFGADIIAGFPTENEEMFENTYNLIKQLNISYLHVFPYSEREGTPACKMPQVDKAIRKSRAAALRDLGAQILLNSNKAKIGKSMQILAESANLGRGEDFSVVKIEGATLKLGEISTITIKGAQDNFLIGVV